MNRLNHIIGMAVILLFFFCFSVFIVVNMSPILYWLAIRWFRLTFKTHLNRIYLMHCYVSLLNYLQNPWERHLRLIYFYSSAKGIHHFLDVKYLFIVNNLGVLLFGALSICIFRGNDINNGLWQFLMPLKMELYTLITVFCMIIVNFQAAFISFHRIFFRNQDWFFHANMDPIIIALPLSFFALCFIFVCLFCFLLILLWIHLINCKINYENGK